MAADDKSTYLDPGFVDIYKFSGNSKRDVNVNSNTQVLTHKFPSIRFEYPDTQVFDSYSCPNNLLFE